MHSHEGEKLQKAKLPTDSHEMETDGKSAEMAATQRANLCAFFPWFVSIRVIRVFRRLLNRNCQNGRFLQQRAAVIESWAAKLASVVPGKTIQLLCLCLLAVCD